MSVEALVKLRGNYPEISMRAFAKLVGITYWRLRDFIRSQHKRQQRAKQQAQLKAHIKRVALEYTTYGYRNIYLELQDQGVKIGRHKVRKLLAELNLNPPAARKRRAKPQVTAVKHWPAGRRIQIDATNVKLAKGSAWVYIVQDVNTRACLAIKVVEALSMHKAKQTLEEAVCTLHKQGVTQNIVIQSDGGSDFTSKIFQATCSSLGQWVRTKINQKGGMGILERLNRTFKHEFCFRRNPETLSQLYEIAEAFKYWYNHIRKHTSIGFKTPWSILCNKAILS